MDLNEKVYHVADSTFYTEDNIKSVGNNAFLVSRVPAIINEGKELLFADLIMETCSDENYSCCVSKSFYGEVEQLWIVFCSEGMKKRGEKMFWEKINKNLKV